MPEVTIERAVEWYDTDAAGHQHHSVILRWAEAAEAELCRRHGVAWLFGRTPRVRHEVDYRSRLWFGELCKIRFWVESFGRTSLTFAFEVHGEHGLAATGSVVVVHAEPDQESASPWPPEVVAALGGES
ncbi:thioesterase family protein [Kutzneria buriramensis]|uniref:Acyl-CoA thioester hydrolase n=1 Tax=Kutzneria buriramensis TaxID=1045776 RepID=A0A3E0I5J9_9PSEU|nr:thioesterase family protein [Kutzneria buriramensis]REH54013.1 acyl-CoA thioester hydrolase [Kutzneria buriramensis]